MRRRSFGTIVVGANPVLREGLARIIGGAGFRIVASAPRINDIAVDSILNHQSVLLIIEATNHAGDAIEQIALFKKQHPTARIAVLCSDCEQSDIVAAFRSGANAYLVSVASCEALIKTLDLVMLGETILPPEVLPLNHDNEDKQEDKSIERGVTTRAAGLVGVRSGFAPHLSNQEINVLRCLLEGDANKVIARRIHIAEATVRVYIKTILRKIRVENRTQAALWAMSNLSLLESKASGAPAKVASRPEVTTHCVRVSPETEKPETQMIEAGQAGEVPLDPKPEPSSSSGR